MTTLNFFLETLELAKKYNFNLDIEDFEITNLENELIEIREFIFETMPEKDYINLDNDEIDGDSGSVTFKLPFSEVTVSGEFEYDKEKEIFTHTHQDIDGKVYKIEW